MGDVTKFQISVLQSNPITALFFLLYILIQFVLMIYAIIALWIGHPSGKWAWLIYLILGSTDYFFVKIVAGSWITFGVTNVYMILTGLILGIAFENKRLI